MRVIERTDTAIGLFIGRDPMSESAFPAAWARDEGRAVEISGDADIADLIAHAVNIGALDPDDLPDLRIYVDGVAAPFATFEEKAETLDLRPGPGSIVNLQVEPAGGSNNLGRTILTVVLTAVAVVAAFTVGPFTAALWQLGAAIVPQLAFPIKTPDRLAGPNDQGGLNAQSNMMRPRGMMPLQLGAGRVAFDVAANAYSSHINGETWLTVIFGVHYGPCSVADIKIGETLLSDYPASDIQVEQLLTPGPREFSFYAQSVKQENLSDELDIGGPAEVHTTAEVCRRVEVDLTWPSGLQFRKDNGSIVQQEIRCQIRWAPVGTEDWQAAPLEGGPYYDRLGAALPAGTVDVIARTQDPVRRTFGWDKANDDQIKIEINAWDPDNDDATKATQTTYWTAIRSIVKKKPIVDQNLACIALRIKSSDDLGGTLPTVTGVVTPHAPKWTGSAWLDDMSDWEASANPVAHLRMMLKGPAAARPVATFDQDANHGYVHDLIIERGWQGCYRLSTEATQEDALKVLGAIGRFSAYDAGEGLVLVPDWEKFAPRQLFTGRNVQGYSYTRTYPDPVHAVVVEFQNVDEDGKQDEVTVYNTGYDADTATLLETIRFDWQMAGERATREGYVFLAKRNISVEIHEWTAGPSAIASSYGSRVLLRHYSALYGQGEGRVQFRHMSGGLVTGVRLDDEVEMKAGEVYAIDVQRVDRIIPGLAVVTAAGRTRDLIFPTPLTVENAPEAGDLVAFGRAEIVTEDLEIIDFAPAGDQVQISARKYVGPQLVEAETGEIPEFNTKLTPSAKAPKPRLLGVTQATPDGIKIAFDITEVRGDLIDSFPVRWRRASTGADKNPWATAATVASNARVAQTPPFPEAVSAGKDPDAVFRVDVEIRTKLRSGDISEPLLVPNILITRGVSDPQGFDAYGAAREGTDGSTYPVLYVQADALASGLEQDLVVEIRPHGAGDDAWFSAGKALPSTNPRGDFAGQAPGAILDVRAQWRTSDNFTSNWVGKSNVLIPPGSLVSSDTRKLGDIAAEVWANRMSAAKALADDAQGDAREANLRILAEVASSANRDFATEKVIRGPAGLPLGPVVVDQVRKVEQTNEVIAEHYVELTARQDEAAAALVAEQIVRNSETSALAADQVSLAATMASNNATATSALAALATTTATQASDILALAATFNGNVSTINGQLTTLATAQGTQATTLSSLSSAVGAHTAAINIQASTLATLSGQVAASYGVDLTADGVTIGFKGINNGETGGWKFRGQYFGIETLTGGVKNPFFVDGSTVYLADTVVDGDLLLTGSLRFTAAPAGEFSPATSFIDSTGVDLTTSYQTVCSYMVYCAAGDLDVVSALAVQNSATSDAGVTVGLFLDGVLIDEWNVAFRRTFTSRDSQETTVPEPSVGWRTVSLQVKAIESGSSLRKVQCRLAVKNRRR